MTRPASTLKFLSSCLSSSDGYTAGQQPHYTHASYMHHSVGTYIVQLLLLIGQLGHYAVVIVIGVTSPISLFSPSLPLLLSLSSPSPPSLLPLSSPSPLPLLSHSSPLPLSSPSPLPLLPLPCSWMLCSCSSHTEEM